MPRLPPGAWLAATGVAAIAVLFVLYARYQDPVLFTPDAVEPLVRMAYMFYVVFAVSLGAVAAGLYRYHRASLSSRGMIGTIARATWNGKSRRVFAATFAIYGALFSLSSGVLVYQPEFMFSYHYGAQVPSAFVAPCCDSPGYMPMAIAYLTEHVGLQVVPINLVLQVAVSYLVALNMSLAVSAISAARGGGASSVGAATGLFIACPTCAGTFLSFFAGTASGVLAAAALAQLQTVMIGISIPVLLATPFIMARRMRA